MRPFDNTLHTPGDGSALRVYLLGGLPFETALALQRALVYQVSGERHNAALLLCEHPPLITVGREGNPAQIGFDPDELRARRWPVRWVNRGGGCLLHLPGQLAVYAVIALDRYGLGVTAYLQRLQRVFVAVLDDFGVQAGTRAGHPGVWVGPRRIADGGVAVRDWVSYFGLCFNINPDLQPFRDMRGRRADESPMTSLERERRGPLRTATVRERIVEDFARIFALDRTALFFNHPLLTKPSIANGVAASS